MADKTKIEWTDASWNPTRGCSRVSTGCERCYAERQAIRHSGPGRPYEGTVKSTPKGPRWTGHIKLVPKSLDQPLRWRRPRRIFVNSMSDLFHEDIPFKFVAAVFGVMAAAKNHTFQVLTKRPEVAQKFFKKLDLIAADLGAHGPFPDDPIEWRRGHLLRAAALDHVSPTRLGAVAEEWPLSNVWLGISCEDQVTANERIPKLLRCPASTRFISAEPLLAPIDLSPFIPSDTWVFRDGWHVHEQPKIDWVIVGGESGPGARRCDATWIRRILRRCTDTATPCFVKQLGADAYDTDYGSYGTMLGLKHRKGGDIDEWPDGLRVRQWPAQT